jgi:hypothetical protein
MPRCGTRLAAKPHRHLASIQERSMNPTSIQPPPSSDDAIKEAQERAKRATENVSQGYGSTVKSKIISAKPDGDTQGGPGSNNDNAIAPPSTQESQAKPGTPHKP